MQWNNQTKGLLILLLCSLFIYGFSQLGSSANKAFFNKGTYTKETKVASITIEGLTKEQALQSLFSELSKWQEKTTIILEYDHEAILDSALFQFQPETTLNQVKDGTITTVEVVLEEGELERFLQREFPSVYSAINLQQLTNDIQTVAKNLDRGIFKFDLNEYIQMDQLEKTVISEASISVAENSNIDFKQNEIIVSIEPGTTFSLQEFLTENQFLDIDNESVSKLATVLYKAILSSPFEVIERHISSELPDYAELGMEAAFIQNQWDFKFHNSQDQAYDLFITKTNDQIVVKIKGFQSEEYKLEMKDEKSYPTRTIVQYDPSLAPSQMQVMNKGKDGRSITVVRQVYVNGEFQNELTISEDYYPPVYKSVKQGLKSGLNEISNDEQENEENKTEQLIPPSEDLDTDNVQTDKENEDSSNNTTGSNDKENQDEELWETPEIMK
ncbi:VanW family protein [Metabacillus bambusae]|uniref:VanW family protein n=1 Tax=Metabacillus bambusae TaxID=2795218 RepID=A0ABS3N8X8_9BACI|nr:VanW family protein [Metabacillus bambusae]MBO1514754.1 VanW family protein [Metabacillus bambusae]